jgi:hypothetical protein
MRLLPLEKLKDLGVGLHMIDLGVVVCRINPFFRTAR